MYLHIMVCCSLKAGDFSRQLTPVCLSLNFMLTCPCLAFLSPLLLVPISLNLCPLQGLSGAVMQIDTMSAE